MSGDERETQRPAGYASASQDPRARASELGGGRDRDPPPSNDGENQELTFRNFEKQVSLWQFETEVPKAKRGVKLLPQLSGVAARSVRDRLRRRSEECDEQTRGLLPTALGGVASTCF